MLSSKYGIWTHLAGGGRAEALGLLPKGKSMIYKELFNRLKCPNSLFKLYENVIKTLGPEDVERLEGLKDDATSLIRFTYGLEGLRTGLQIREAFPEKNHHESKAKREYGNRAYKDGKDIDALYLYTQARVN